VGETLSRWIGYCRPSRTPRPALASLAVLACVATAGCADALSTTYDDRLVRREIGQWIASSLGPGQAILGSEPRAWTVAYYAHGHYYGPALEEVGQAQYLGWTRTHLPAVVLVSSRSRAAENSAWYHAFLRDEQLSSQFRPVPPEHLPASARHMFVLVRTPLWAQAVRRQAAGPDVR
jgi:hypothetical protein